MLNLEKLKEIYLGIIFIKIKVTNLQRHWSSIPL